MVNVDDKDKKTFSELKQYIHTIPSNAQPHSIYINETGLYYLVFGSKKELAKKFKRWVLEIVLPSIRRYGYYQIEEKYEYKVKFLEEKLKNIQSKLRNAQSRIRILENNQKKQKFPDGGLVYALEYMVQVPYKKGYKMIRIGKSEWMNGRWSTHNSSVPDNYKLVHYVKVNNPIAVEKCVQGMLNTYKYRTEKDFYLTTKKKIVNVQI